MGLQADGAHARAAAAVGDAEGLVQVHVAHVRANGGGGGEAHLGVHVGPVHVHLTAVLVNGGADVADRLFKHPVGGGVGDHQGGKALGVLLGLGLQVGQIHVAVVVAVHHHHVHAAHLGGGRVGAVGRLGDQAHIAVAVAPGSVVALDGHQAGVLTLGTGVGLHADGVKAGHGAQLGGQTFDHLPVALGLVGGGEGVDVG